MAAGFLRRKRNTWFVRIRLPRRVAACGLSGELQQTLRISDRRLAGRMARVVALRLEAALESAHIPPRAELEGMVRSWIDELHWRLETRRAATGGYGWFEPDELARMGPETSCEIEALLRLSHRLFQAAAIAPNVLDRVFAAPAPNRRWIADFTYIWTAEGWLYVAAVVDLFSRRVVGWSMSAAMTAQLVTDALVMAIWRRGKPDALVHHSDRGSQYSSEQFQRLMADHGVVCSMSRSGNVWDNAAMESFFSSLKTERTAAKTYRSRDEAKADVFDYIECFYNARRRHSTIGYLSPMEFERRAGFA